MFIIDKLISLIIDLVVIVINGFGCFLVRLRVWVLNKIVNSVISVVIYNFIVFELLFVFVVSRLMFLVMVLSCRVM